MTLEHVLILSAILFSIGLYGVLTKRNPVTVLMAIELMFNAVNVALVGMSRYVVPASLRTDPTSTADQAVQLVLTGQVFAIFVTTVAAAEIALGLAIVIAIYRNQGTVDVSEINLMSG